MTCENEFCGNMSLEECETCGKSFCKTVHFEEHICAEEVVVSASV